MTVGWEICPFLFAPSFFLCVVLIVMCDNFRIAERISRRFNWRQKTVEKCIGAILYALSLVIVGVALLLIYHYTGVDLINLGA